MQAFAVEEMGHCKTCLIVAIDCEQLFLTVLWKKLRTFQTLVLHFPNFYAISKITERYAELFDCLSNGNPIVYSIKCFL